uniref:Mitochondrial ribosomal protein L1 n=1 Tax=Stegastes partitus TaxID=144197 RepID=A0A3B5BN24_9TELE
MSLFSPGQTLFPVMATCTRTVWKVLAGCQRQLLSTGVPAGVSPSASRTLPVRTFAALSHGFNAEEEKEVKKEKKVIDDKDRHKPYGKTAWVPVDDVYVIRYYALPVHAATNAIEMLKNFQALDFTPPNQPVYIDLKLKMQLEKKKKIDPFVSTVHLPHPFKTELNKVVVFTEVKKKQQQRNESDDVCFDAFLVRFQILDDKISADFYIAVPDILPKLVPLKNKLRKKFPKNKRGTVGINIPKMLELFKVGHEYLVESDCYVRTQIATLNMPSDHIFSNLQTVLADVCTHRPADMGTFHNANVHHRICCELLQQPEQKTPAVLCCK